MKEIERREIVARALALSRIEHNRKIGGEAWIGRLPDYDEMDDEERGDFDTVAQAALTALQEAGLIPGPDEVIVPREPTEEMILHVASFLRGAPQMNAPNILEMRRAKKLLESLAAMIGEET